jgi:pantetheine-phosphate adenylyltransferase
MHKNSERIIGACMDMKTNGKHITAIYPGSFDPITNGHIDLVERSLCLFDKIIIAILINPEKEHLFTLEERRAMVEEIFKDTPRIEIDIFDGLLVNYAKRKNASVLVRGIRAFSDFEYEFQMALMNRKMSQEIETVFLMPAEKYSYLSSRLVREIFKLGGSLECFIPEIVNRALKKKFNR